MKTFMCHLEITLLSSSLCFEQQVKDTRHDTLFTLHVSLQEPVRGTRVMPSVGAWLLYVHVCKHVGLCLEGSQSR